MTKQRKLAFAIAGALGVLASTGANAGIGLKAGEWDLDFSGNVNGFATSNHCDNKATGVAGGLACNGSTLGGAPAAGAPTNVNAVESGLLPSALVFSAKSQQGDFDVGVTFGFYPTLRTTPGGGNTALGASAINVRQNFLTFGNKSWGTIKVGRDLGLFGGDAILSDMTLLGVGSGAAVLGGQTTLGRIGIGYIYADWIPQISYWSPNYNGFQFAGGVFQAFDDIALGTALSGGVASNSAALTGHDQFGYQLKASYEWTGDVAGKVWGDYMNQKNKLTAPIGFPAVPAGSSKTGNAWDLGGKISVSGFEAVLYGYTGSGVGTTAIGADAIGFTGAGGGGLAKRDSNGGYAQVTYKFDKVKVGLSYGESRLKLADGEGLNALNNSLVNKNKSTVLGVYYSLTKSVNLVAEYIETKAQAQNSTTNPELKDDAIAVGAILFF